MGYDTRTIKKVIALGKKDGRERLEDLILDAYLGAPDMIAGELADEEDAA
jgi:uncharacterized protein (UPF0335 family)